MLIRLFSLWVALALFQCFFFPLFFISLPLRLHRIVCHLFPLVCPTHTETLSCAADLICSGPSYDGTFSGSSRPRRTPGSTPRATAGSRRASVASSGLNVDPIIGAGRRGSSASRRASHSSRRSSVANDTVVHMV